jgi:hypothetical protein
MRTLYILTAAQKRRRFARCTGAMLRPGSLTLTRFEAALHLVDDIDTAFTAHQPIASMPAAQRFQ